MRRRSTRPRQRDLINATIAACDAAPLADLADAPRDAAVLSVAGRTKSLDRLPSFGRLEYLTLDRPDQSTLDAVIGAVQPRYLVMWNLEARDLSALAGLRRLERLVITGAGQVTDIAALGALRTLELLSLEAMPKARDLAPLATLGGLHHLCFAGGHYASPKKVPTLALLSRLTQLRTLNLIGVTAADRSLAPLAPLTKLEEISLSNCWPTEEFARASVLFPDAGCEWFAPYVEDKAKAGGLGFSWHATVFITGARQPTFTRPTKADRKRIAEYVAAFEDLQDAFRKQYGRDTR